MINENKGLSSRLKATLNVYEKEEIEHEHSENDLIENLKNQLNILTQEKESVAQLWQTALQTVDYLEEELKLYEGRVHGYISKSELKKVLQLNL